MTYLRIETIEPDRAPHQIAVVGIDPADLVEGNSMYPGRSLSKERAQALLDLIAPAVDVTRVAEVLVTYCSDGNVPFAREYYATYLDKGESPKHSFVADRKRFYRHQVQELAPIPVLTLPSCTQAPAPVDVAPMVTPTAKRTSSAPRP